MAVSSQQIVDFLIANPNMSDAEIASVMNQFGVSPSDVAAATGADEAVVQARFDEVAPTVAAPIDEPVAAPVYEAPTAPVYEAPATPVVAPVAAPTGQISTQQIVDFLATNPTNAEIGKAMETFKVSPTQIADALASQEAKLGATTTVVENAETGQTSSVLNDLGGGFNAYRDENGNLSYSRVDPANPDKIQLYGPKGKYGKTLALLLKPLQVNMQVKYCQILGY